MATYTLDDEALDGTWDRTTPTFSAGTTKAESVGSADSWAILHFDGVDTTDSIVTTATLTLVISPGATMPGRYAVEVVIVNDGAPTDDTIPLYRTTRIGVLTVTQNPGVAETMDLLIDHLNTGSTGTSFSWVTKGYGNGGITALNAAWGKRERDPNDTDSFLARTVTFVVKPLAAEQLLTIRDVTNDPAVLEVTFTPSQTGLVGLQYVRDKARGVASGLYQCPRCDFPVARDVAVLDGYTGSWVHPDCYDRRMGSRPRPPLRQKPRVGGSY
jgi:hypothetical protein